MNAPDRLPHRVRHFAELLASPAGATALCDPNRPLFASLLAGQAARAGCLPADLGLGAHRYRALLDSYFPGCAPTACGNPAVVLPEVDELRGLLQAARNPALASADWMVDILIAGCAGRDHLWQDLGLFNRDELSRLMQVNFPELARANTGDMKWKKFLYRQVCAHEGIYVCPAPSCGVCTDYARCFGPET